MALSDLTRPAVLAAIAEFDADGRDEFLKRYGFGKARGYYLEHGGRPYDSKAIAGAAHGHLGAGWAPLGPEDFSGGNATVVPVLRALGFNLEFHQNPDWTRDELLLALDLYLRTRAKPLPKGALQIVALSKLLNDLAARLGEGTSKTFRNPAGVYMKLMNFRRLDPAVAATGAKGLQRGNDEEPTVWREFAEDPDRLAAIVAAIRGGIESTVELVPMALDDDEAEAPEGRLLTRLHHTRERSAGIARRRKQSALAKLGKLSCEACDFDFSATYGDRGAGFIEAHHTTPVYQLIEGHKTRPADLALLCANCHRMIHAKRPWLAAAVAAGNAAEGVGSRAASNCFDAEPYRRRRSDAAAKG